MKEPLTVTIAAVDRLSVSCAALRAASLHASFQAIARRRAVSGLRASLAVAALLPLLIFAWGWATYPGHEALPVEAFTIQPDEVWRERMRNRFSCCFDESGPHECRQNSGGLLKKAPGGSR